MKQKKPIPEHLQCPMCEDHIDAHDSKGCLICPCRRRFKEHQLQEHDMRRVVVGKIYRDNKHKTI